jgi:hypothetical protein
MSTNPEGKITITVPQEKINFGADILVIKAILDIQDELKAEDLLSILNAGEKVENDVGTEQASQKKFITEYFTQKNVDLITSNNVDLIFYQNFKKYSLLISNGFTNERLHKILELLIVEVEQKKIREEKKANLKFKVWYEDIINGTIELKTMEDRLALILYLREESVEILREKGDGKIREGRIDLEKFRKIQEKSQKTFIPNPKNGIEEEYLPDSIFINNSRERIDFKSDVWFSKWAIKGLTAEYEEKSFLEYVKKGVVTKSEFEAIKKATSENGSGIDLSNVKLPEIILPDQIQDSMLLKIN